MPTSRLVDLTRHSSATDSDGHEAERGLPLSWQRNPAPLALLSRAEAIAFQVALALMPSWLRPPPDKHLPLKTPRETAYLDGLRGVVSILVFIRHFSLPWQRHLDYGYGDQGCNGFLRLPFLRLVFSGPLTPVFFIVSGYVLSAKSLRLSRRKAWEPLAVALAGSTFRRALRLFLAPIFSTFLVMVLAHLGCFSFPYGTMPGRQPVHPVALASFWAQLLQWGGFIMNELTNPWRWDIPTLEYGPHLWTIPVSFKGSLVVFLACLGLIRTQGATRLVLLILGVLWALLHSRWDMAPFIGGMMLCELDLRNAERLDRSKDPNRRASSWWRQTLRRAISLACLVFGLYLGSFPRKNHNGKSCVAGFQLFCVVTHNYRYWHCIGAFFVMFAISREKYLQRPLNTALGLYLGQISFSVYILHEPFLHIFAFYTVPFFRYWTGQSNELQSQAGFFIGMVFSLFWLLWLADLFKIHVEDYCVKLAGWVESKVLS